MKAMQLALSPRTLLVASLAAAFASCSDSDDDGGSNLPPEDARVDVLIGDAPVDDLLAFSAEVQSIRLRRTDGTFTPDLMSSGPVRVEFLGLGDELVLVAHGALESGSFDAVEAGFVPGSYRALSADGGELTVAAGGDVLLARLPATLDVEADEYVRLEVDVDLLDSIEGDVAAGSVAFEPEGDAVFHGGLPLVRVRELKALFTGAEGTEAVVDAFADTEQSVPLGDLTVTANGPVLFLDENGQELTASEFAAAVEPGSTLLDLHGSLCHQGILRAKRLEIEDQNGGAGSLDLVRIEGVVVATSASGFTLRVREVQDGESVAGPVLDALVGPETIDVSFDAGTVFVRGDQLAQPDALELGSWAAVKFCAFATEPFPACQVSVAEREPRFLGGSTDVVGLPDTFVARLDAHDPAVTGGLVQDGDTDVTVDAGSASFVLDLRDERPLVAADLVSDARVGLEGAFSGPASAPSFAATKIRVRPGFLDDARVTGATAATSTILTTGGTLVDSFGPAVTAGDQLVRLEPGATVSGDVATVAELFALLTGPQAAEVELDVLGLGNGVANEIRAFHVEAEVTGDEPPPGEREPTIGDKEFREDALPSQE